MYGNYIIYHGTACTKKIIFHGKTPGITVFTDFQKIAAGISKIKQDKSFRSYPAF